MKEYCDDKGIADDYIQGLSAQFYGNDNPVERAKNIAEGLRLANVSADSNLALMSDIARAEDPIALGRAASIIEASIKSLDNSLRHEILKLILNGQNPETTANEIVRSIDEIQKYGLTIKDIGVRGLFGVSRKEPSTVERYCSDWKIGHESELAYQEYWRPARETGQLSSINIESKPKIIELPELSKRLESLGIPPQLVQVMNGWPKRRSAGSRISRRQSAQVAISGGTRVLEVSSVWLSMISKRASPRVCTAVTAMVSIRAIGGGRCCSALTAASTSGAGPSNSQCTAPASL